MPIQSLHQASPLSIHIRPKVWLIHAIIVFSKLVCMYCQAFTCADAPFNMVVGVRCMFRPILAAEFDMVCTDYRRLAANFRKLASNDALQTGVSLGKCI